MRYGMLLDNCLVNPPIPWVLFGLGAPADPWVLFDLGAPADPCRSLGYYLI